MREPTHVGGLTFRQAIWANPQKASSRASRYLADLLIGPSSVKVPQGTAEQVVANLILEIHARLRKDRQHYLTLQGMATTASVALITRGTPTIL